MNMITFLGAALVAVVVVLYLECRGGHRGARVSVRASEDSVGQAIKKLADEVSALRSALVVSGAAERMETLPPPVPHVTALVVPILEPPFLERSTAPVARHEAPVRDRATVEEMPPSTKPSAQRARDHVAAKDDLEGRRTVVLSISGAARSGEMLSPRGAPNVSTADSPPPTSQCLLARRPARHVIPFPAPERMPPVVVPANEPGTEPEGRAS